MAVTAVSNTLFTGKRKFIVHLTGLSADATNESGVVKVDRSTFTKQDGSVPDTIKINSVRWATQGFTYVKVLWHHNAADVTALLLTSNGYDNFEVAGGLTDTDTTNADAADGDIQITTVGAITNATYDITLECEF